MTDQLRPFLVVPADGIASGVSIAIFRAAEEPALARAFDVDPARMAELAAEASLWLGRFDALFAAAARVGAHAAPVLSRGTRPNDGPFAMEFGLDDGTTVRFEERRSRDDLARSIRHETPKGITLFRITGIPHDARMRGPRPHIPTIRAAVASLGRLGTGALDALLGRNDRARLVCVPEDVEEAARACVRVVGDRNRIPDQRERTGKHVLGTPWSRPRTVLDDVSGTPSPAEAAWLPHVAAGEIRHEPVGARGGGDLSLSLAPVSVPATFGASDPIQHMRSLAAIAGFRPEED